MPLELTTRNPEVFLFRKLKGTGYSFQALFEFAARKLRTAPAAMMLEQLDATLISAFLEHLETNRRNSAETRNIRLAAIRSFFRFLQHREPAAVEQVRRVLAIPFKKTDTRLVSHLVQEEMQALLDAPDCPQRAPGLLALARPYQ